MYCPQCSYNNPVGAQCCKNCELRLESYVYKPDLPLAPAALIYAGFWLRFYAALLDLLVLGAGITLVLSLSIMLIAYTGRDDLLRNAEILWLSLGLVISVSLAYTILLESGARGATLGKRWMNIKLLDSNGDRLTLSRSVGRLLARLVSFLPALLGFLIQPFTPRKQALHDLLAGTIVVRSGNSNKIPIIATLLVLFYLLLLPVLAIVATTGRPFFRQIILKAQLDRGLQTGINATQAVENFYLKNGRVPTVIDDAAPNISLSPQLAGIVINQTNGEISVSFSAIAGKPLANKHLLFSATMKADRSISWKCSSRDIDKRILPATCK